MRNLFLRLSSIAAFVVVAALGGGCPGGTTIIDPGTDVVSCSSSEQCGAGLVCAAGACVIGTCDPLLESQCGADVSGDARSPFCCKVFENCSTLTLTCERDPSANGIGCPPNEPDCTPCVEDGDCGAAGDFCSGGRCFSPQGRTDCTQSFQCPTAERCDRTVFLCVPDNGGCTFCGPDFPELCCENSQVCDSESGLCVAVDGNECTVATQASDCRAGQKCDTLGRCVQCVVDGDCGPGLACNVATGACFSTVNQCSTDAECGQGRRCSPQTDECVVPACESDDECLDDRERCDLERFQCFLPPATCSESDEPNNSPATAVALDSLATGYAGVLCRGDSDFVSFPVVPGKRYTATITVTGTPFSGLTAAMTDTTGAVESSATFAITPATVVVNGVSGVDETGRFAVRITGSSNARDNWNYTVSLREQDASAEPDCSDAGQAAQEPNDTFEAAAALTPGAALAGTRCGTDDVDFFKVTVPALHGVTVTVDQFFNAEGNLNVELFKAPLQGQRVDTSTTTTDSETVDAPEGTIDYWVKVSLGSVSGALENQGYRIVANAVARPASCDGDVEDDGAPANAQTIPTAETNGLVSGTLSARFRCNPQDVDHYKFTLPANLGGTIRTNFTHNEGNLALDLLDATTGAVVATSDTSSTTSPAESIELPQSASARDFVARVRLASTGTANIIAQPYSVVLSTFDASTCVATEPAPDNTFDTGRCVGDFAIGMLPACNGDRLAEPLTGTAASCALDAATPGCMRACGNQDADFYRLGELQLEQSVLARLEFTPSEGGLQLVLHRRLTAGTSIVQTLTDADNDGVITLEFTPSVVKEHAIAVVPTGTLGHAAQAYALSIDVSAPCTADTFEGTSGNSTPATSSVVTDFTNPLAATTCFNDIDVYEVLATNEQITATITGPVGVRLTPGTRPANLNSPAVAIATSPAVTIGDSGTGSVTVPVTATRATQLYFTVDRTTGAGTGAYTLTLSSSPLPPP